MGATNAEVLDVGLFGRINIAIETVSASSLCFLWLNRVVIGVAQAGGMLLDMAVYLCFHAFKAV